MPRLLCRPGRPLYDPLALMSCGNATRWSQPSQGDSIQPPKPQSHACVNNFITMTLNRATKGLNSRRHIPLSFPKKACSLNKY